MKLKLTVETISPNGAKDVRTEEIIKEEVVLGRGPGCDVIIDNNSVSLRHARLAPSLASPLGVRIEALESLSGVLVNDAPIRFHELKSGDHITLGSVQLEMRGAEGALELYRVHQAEERLDFESRVKRDIAATQVMRNMPAMALLSLVFSAIVLGYYFVLPVATDKKASWSSGPIAPAHRMIEHDCQACHEGTFKRISDQKCRSCHELSDHAEVLSRFQQQHPDQRLEPSCANCHLDHNGPHGLIARSPRLCTECHGSFKAVADRIGDSKEVRAVLGFDEHPEFAVTLQPEKEGGSTRRVRLDDVPALKDISNIKLNHRVHLEPNLRTRSGRKTLDCQYCHELSGDFRTIKKIEFEKNCQECHALEFDERIPSREVPHGDPDVVYRFLYAEYAKLLLGSEVSSPTRTVFQQRGGRIPGKTPAAQVEEQRAPDDFSKAFVERESRGAEKILFTKTACYLCHAVSDRKAPETEIRDKSLSYFQVLKPRIPERWMPESRFSHGAHEEVRCENCHQGVRKSEKTSDVLLPKIETCRECHAAKLQPGKVSGECIECHSYHDAKPIPNDRKRDIQDIVLRVK